MDRSTGLAAARELGVKDLVGKRVVVLIKPEIYVGISFVKAFLGNFVRKNGTDMVRNLWTFEGGRSDFGDWGCKLAKIAKRRGEIGCGRSIFMAYLDQFDEDQLKKLEKSRPVERSWSDDVQLRIPDVGTVIRLEQDWAFDLFYESRNETIIDFIGWDEQGRYPYYRPVMKVVPETGVVLKAGAILKIDRVYIRKGASEFSSISFFWENPSDDMIESAHVRKTEASKKKVRFWAKLRDVNNIRCSIDDYTIPTS